MKRAWVVIAVLGSLLGTTDLAAQEQPVSELVELVKNKVDDSIVLEVARRTLNGTPLNAKAIVELKQAGASDALLKQIVSLSGPQAPSSVSDTSTAAAMDEIQRGKYEEAIQRLESGLSVASPSVRSMHLFLLAVANLSAGHPNRAQEYATLLEQVNSGDSAKLATKYAQFRARREARDAEVANYIGRLVTHDRAAVADFYKGTKLDENAIAILRSNELLLQGKFDESTASTASIKSARARRQMADRIEAISTFSKKQQEDLDFYYNRASVYCAPTPDWKWSFRSPEPDFNWAHIREATTALYAVTPFDPLVMTRALHWQMVSGEPEQFLELADHILRWNGSVKFPMNSDRDRFDLVVDRVRREIYVENVRTGPMSYYEREKPDLVEGNAATRTFDMIRFEDVSFLDQRAGGAFGNNTFLEGDAIALRFNKKQIVPQWTGMAFAHCMFGGEKQRKATRNLGLFVQKTVGLADDKTSLAKPTPQGFNMVPLVNFMAAEQQRRMKTGDLASADMRNWDASTWSRIFGDAGAANRDIMNSQEVNWEKVAANQAIKLLDSGDVEQLLGAL